MAIESLLYETISKLHGAEAVTDAVPASFTGAITAKKIKAELSKMADNISKNIQLFMKMIGVSYEKLKSIASLEKLEALVEKLVKSAQIANADLVGDDLSLTDASADADEEAFDAGRKRYGMGYGFGYGGFSFLKFFGIACEGCGIFYWVYCVIKSVFKCLRYATCKLIGCIRGLFKNFIVNILGLLICPLKKCCKGDKWHFAIFAAVLLFFFGALFIFITAFLECLFCGSFGNICCNGCGCDFIGDYGWGCCCGGSGCGGCAPVRFLFSVA